MDEQRLQFRVGLFVLASIVASSVLMVRFGDLRRFWQESYALAIQFDTAPGVHPGTPVRVNGIGIGRVRKVLLDDAEPGVLVVVDIESQFKLRSDSKPTLSVSLFGDAIVEFSPGAAGDYLPPNKRLRGEAPQDPLKAVARMEEQLAEVVASFRATSREWELVGNNINSLLETERGSLESVIEKTAISLDEFSRAMQSGREMVENANQLVADPAMQARLRETIDALPQLVQETRDTIAAAKVSVQRAGESLEKVNANLDQVHAATAPLAEQSRNLVSRLDGGLIELEALLTELHAFAAMMNDEDGSLQKFASDPDLYDNLNRSASSLVVLLDNLEPTLRDVRIFSDKVARHPELLGVRGAISGSSGIKEVPAEERQAADGFLPQR
jgi:phospholipid/cholesterol/gamma-HCH transport system substrate-binding protein